MKDVLEIALEYAEQNDVKKIRTIALSVGALASIVPDWAQMFFNYVSKGTIAEEAKIQIETIPAKIRCRSCGAETEMDVHNLLYECNKCDSKAIELVTGREFRVTSMEVE
jgi:hydrogenase nickel incorporation protein HypA/HybF